MSPRILIVEDEENWGQQLSDSLKTININNFDIAQTPAEARHRLEQASYDLIITDLCLDQPDFNFVCQLFFEQIVQQYPTLPIIVVTGRPVLADVGFNLHARYNTIIALMLKEDFDLHEFRQHVQTALIDKRNETDTDTLESTQHDVFISYNRI